MIRNEEEYREARARILEEKQRLDAHRAALQAEGLTGDQVKRLTDPMESFHQQLIDDVTSYERLIRGEFDELYNLVGIGRMLVGLRIYAGITQAQLAERLGVDPAQVSRDERNEYHNITVNRASRIFEALGAKLESTVSFDPPQPKPDGGKIAA